MTARTAFSDRAVAPAYGLPALAVVPGGSTNVFARALGLPRDWVEGTGVILAGLRDGRHRVIGLGRADRKSTRLNSSHANISYAVFCLKKKQDKNNDSIRFE